MTAPQTTPYTTPLTFRTEVRPYLYLASVGLLALGLMFIAFALWGPEGQGVFGALISGVGVFMLYVAWVNFLTTRAGYPHLVLTGHRLTVQSSDAFRRDLDLTALGATKTVVIAGHRGSQSLYLGFLPLPGAKLRPRPFVHQRLQQFAETVLLNGYIGSDLSGAKDIERVIAARRVEPKQDIALPADNSLARSAAKVRLVMTAGVFAALWVGLVWWQLLP